MADAAAWDSVDLTPFLAQLGIDDPAAIVGSVAVKIAFTKYQIRHGQVAVEKPRQKILQFGAFQIHTSRYA